MSIDTYCYEHVYFTGIFGGLFYAGMGETLGVSRQSWGLGEGGGGPQASWVEKAVVLKLRRAVLLLC